MDPDIKALLSILLESENLLAKRLSDLALTVDGFVTSANSFVASANEYVKASSENTKTFNERIILIEKQLDAFLRAIRPQPNGKSEGE